MYGTKCFQRKLKKLNHMRAKSLSRNNEELTFGVICIINCILLILVAMIIGAVYIIISKGPVWDLQTALWLGNVVATSTGCEAFVPLENGKLASLIANLGCKAFKFYIISHSLKLMTQFHRVINTDEFHYVDDYREWSPFVRSLATAKKWNPPSASYRNAFGRSFNKEITSQHSNINPSSMVNSIQQITWNTTRRSECPSFVPFKINNEDMYLLSANLTFKLQRKIIKLQSQTCKMRLDILNLEEKLHLHNSYEAIL